MPGINPTADQLDARLSPTPTTYNLPTEGTIFRATGDVNGDAVYQVKNGQVTTLYSPSYTANTPFIDKSTGIQYNTGDISTNPHDVTWLDQNYRGVATSPTNAFSVYNNATGLDANSLAEFNMADIQQYLSGGGKLGATATNTVNNTPNTLAPGVPSGVQPATVGTQPNQPLTAPTVDYRLQPGETIAQYNARIAAGNPNLPAPGTTSSTGVINSASLTPGSNLNFQSPASSSALQAGAQGSAAATYASTAAQQAAYAETPAQQQESSLSQLLEGLNTQEAGKAAYQNKENSAFGVDTQQATVNDLQSKLATLTNEAATIKMTPQQNEGVTTAVDTRQRDGALQTNAIAALAVSSLLSAANNSLATAQAQANKAVALVFDPIEAQITANMANLKLIQNDPNTTLQEQKQADARQAILTAQAAAIAEQKQNLTDVFKVATDAAGNINNFKATAQYQTASQALTAIQQAHTPGDALMIAASTGLTSGPSTGTWSTPYMLGGSYVQKNSQTGEVRQAVNPPNAPAAPTYSFTPTVKTQLSGAGNSASQIVQLQSDIAAHGAQYVLDNGNMDSATQQIIENEFGITKKGTTNGGLFGWGVFGL